LLGILLVEVGMASIGLPLITLVVQLAAADVVSSDRSYLGHEVDLRPRVGLCLLGYIVLVSS